MLKIKCTYTKLGWISFYTHSYESQLLTYKESVVLTIPKDRLHYYDVFIPLGVRIEVLQDLSVKEQNEVVIEIPVIVEDPVLEESEQIEEVVEEPELNPILNEEELRAYYSDMSKTEIKDILKNLGIQFKTAETKAELVEKLVSANARG